MWTRPADRAPSYGPCGQGLDKCSALAHPFPTLGALAPTSSPPQQQSFMTKATSSRPEASRIAPPSQANRLRNNPAKSRGDPTRQSGKQQWTRIHENSRSTGGSRWPPCGDGRCPSRGGPRRHGFAFVCETVEGAAQGQAGSATLKGCPTPMRPAERESALEDIRAEDGAVRGRTSTSGPLEELGASSVCRYSASRRSCACGPGTSSARGSTAAIRVRGVHPTGGGQDASERRRLQRALAAAGFDPGPADWALFGPRTRQDSGLADRETGTPRPIPDSRPVQVNQGLTQTTPIAAVGRSRRAGRASIWETNKLNAGRARTNPDAICARSHYHSDQTTKWIGPCRAGVAEGHGTYLVSAGQ